jgi:hypothetical protein
VQENAHFITGLLSEATHVSYSPLAASGIQTANHAAHLDAFIAERARRTGGKHGAADVIAFVDRLARDEGPETARNLLDLAARFGDFDIVDYEVYKELLTTSSYASVSASH